MSTGSIKHNIEITDSADAERFIEALEKAKAESEEGMEKKEIIDGLKDLIKDRESFITEGAPKSWKTDTDRIFEHDKQVLEEAINTIQAQQQEIDLLIMEITELRESNQALKDYAENADTDKDEQAGTIMRLDNGLKKLRSSLQWLKETIHDLDYKAWAEDNIGKIDALLGGAEDGK